jgi:hypothetical protein
MEISSCPRSFDVMAAVTHSLRHGGQSEIDLGVKAQHHSVVGTSSDINDIRGEETGKDWLMPLRTWQRQLSAIRKLSINGVIGSGQSLQPKQLRLR